MRSYGQYCALARALDVIGDRWALLIVRELLDGPRRYNELLGGLPGIATNLLAERLRALEATGVIESRADGRYALTPWGSGLREPIYALGRWAGPLMARPVGDDEFRPEWLHHLVSALFDGIDPQRGALTVDVLCEGVPLTLISAAGRVHVVPGASPGADVRLSGPPDALVGVLAGRLDRGAAEARGVSVTGDLRKLRRLRPALRRAPVLAPGAASGTD